MTIKVYATAKNDYNYHGLTKGKEYPVLKVTYQKLFPEGLVTIINDKKELIRVTSNYFIFEAK